MRTNIGIPLLSPLFPLFAAKNSAATALSGKAATIWATRPFWPGAEASVWRALSTMSRSRDERFPGHDLRYAVLSDEELPRAESLKDTVARFLPYWARELVPQLRSGRTVLVSAHGNSLRALVKHLDRIPDNDIPALEIPTGVPLVYELDGALRPIDHHYPQTI